MTGFKNRSLHDKVLIIITQLATMLFIFSACLLDSEDFVQYLIIAAVSFIWIALFIYANRERLYK